MSLFTQPVILVPGSEQLGPNHRRRLSERAPRRNIRRTIRPASVRRALDYDPYEYLFVGDYPESGFCEVPARYVDIRPGRFYGNQTIPRSDQWNPEEQLFGIRSGSSQTRSCHDSVYETERSDESEEEVAEMEVNPVVMDLDQVLGQVFEQLYGKKTYPRHGNVSGKVKEPKGRTKGNRTKKNRTTPKQEAIKDQKRKNKTETKPDQKRKVVDLEIARVPAKSKEDKMVAIQKDADTVQEHDVRGGKELSLPEAGHMEVMSVPDNSSCKEDTRQVLAKDNIPDTSEVEVKSSCEGEVQVNCDDEAPTSCEDEARASCEDEARASCEDEARTSCEDEARASCEDEVRASCEDEISASCEDEARASCEDEVPASCEDEARVCCQGMITDNFEGGTPPSEQRSNEEKEEVKGSDELVETAYTHLTDHTPETNYEHDPEDTPATESTHPCRLDDVKDPRSKFKMIFDFSSFLPEEIQARLTDDKLILDAVHEVIEEGLSEKLTMHKELVLPPGVDLESLRCLLSADGHMIISADYKDNWKHSKILTIEMNGY